MIRFACTCGHGFELADGEAGGMIQCTRCGRLNDVPNHSDLLSLAPDGTYSLDADAPVATDPHRLADVSLVYAKTKHDAQGNEIDLRTLPAGRRLPRAPKPGDDGDDDAEIDLKPPDEPVKVRPRYDPETGELIRELPLIREPERPVDPSSIPMARATINYASGQLARRVSPLRVVGELFMPLNLAVMFSILLLHLFNGVVFVTSIRLIFTWPVLLILQGMILAHYGNVMDDTGRNERDELPRPMGDFSVYDDIWAPFVHMFGGLMIAYLPPLVAATYIPGPSELWLMLALGAGTVVAPAILLTTNTSGASQNLRPDRVLAVMRISGLHYVGVVLLWAVTAPVYFIGWVGFCFCMTGLFGVGVGGSVLNEWRVVLPCLVAGIYLMHLFSWYLGLIYRAHHEAFPWILQRHVRDPNQPRPAGTHADQLGRRRVGRADPVLPAEVARRPKPPAPALPLAVPAPPATSKAKPVAGTKPVIPVRRVRP
jgi:hypothetical protein